jgi:hypothetical protein
LQEKRQLSSFVFEGIHHFDNHPAFVAPMQISQAIFTHLSGKSTDSYLHLQCMARLPAEFPCTLQILTIDSSVQSAVDEPTQRKGQNSFSLKSQFYSLQKYEKISRSQKFASLLYEPCSHARHTKNKQTEKKTRHSR